MREPIRFEVCGLPPNIKKNDRSMDRIPEQKRRLVALQTTAREKLGSQMLTGKIRLALTLDVGCQASVVVKAGKNGFGDLDNFVSGVCDGLEGVAFEDDRHVVKIDAAIVLGSGDHCQYRIELEGE